MIKYKRTIHRYGETHYFILKDVTVFGGIKWTDTEALKQWVEDAGRKLNCFNKIFDSYTIAAKSPEEEFYVSLSYVMNLPTDKWETNFTKAQRKILDPMAKRHAKNMGISPYNCVFISIYDDESKKKALVKYVKDALGI